MSDSTYNSSPTKSTGVGLTRANVLGAGLDSNTPGSRKGIQGVSLTPARSIITSTGISLSSGRPQRERYQSAYSGTSRLGGSHTYSAPNISNLSNLNTERDTDNSSEIITPRRINLSSLKLTPRRGSADPRITKLEQINDEDSNVGKTETPRRGSDIAGSSLLRKQNVEQTGYRRSPISLTRTHSDVEYSQKLRDRASRTSATFSPRSPNNDVNGNGDSAKPDSGYNSPRINEFSYSVTASPNSPASNSNVQRLSEASNGNTTNKANETDDINKSDSTDGGYVTIKDASKVRCDSGYHSPRHEASGDTLQNKIVLPQEPPVGNEIDKTYSAKDAWNYLGNSENDIIVTYDETSNIRTGNSSIGQTRDSKPKPLSVSRATNLEDTPEHSVLNTNPLNSGSAKENSSFSGMSATRPEMRDKTITSAVATSGNTVVSNSDSPTPQPRTRRRLTKRMSFKRVEDDEYIGFASLPEQVHRKAVRRGFEFTLMVVGETGLGKSTLINSLFLTDLYKDRKFTNSEERIQKTVDLEKKELEIEERGVKLKLTIVDTPGFNDAVNAEESWKPIVNYVDKQFDAYFKAESGLNRKNIKDTRVHCCLYFISPYGHGLRPADILVMKKLHNKVNIVPLIAKSDMLTKPECKRLKEKITAEIERHRIHIYQFPDCDSDEDEEFKQQDKELKASIPFAVVGSNTVVEAGGKKIRGRMYPWGIVEVENPQHCDFIQLRQMLISTHMQDLKDVTCDIHYENYRAEHISEQMGTQRRDRNKLKRDSTPNMEAVLETDLLLQQKEAEIQRMREVMKQMEAKIRSQNSPQMNGRVGNV